MVGVLVPVCGSRNVAVYDWTYHNDAKHVACFQDVVSETAKFFAVCDFMEAVCGICTLPIQIVNLPIVIARLEAAEGMNASLPGFFHDSSFSGQW